MNQSITQLDTAKALLVRAVLLLRNILSVGTAVISFMLAIFAVTRLVPAADSFQNAIVFVAIAFFLLLAWASCHIVYKAWQKQNDVGGSILLLCLFFFVLLISLLPSDSSVDYFVTPWRAVQIVWSNEYLSSSDYTQVILFQYAAFALVLYGVAVSIEMKDEKLRRQRIKAETEETLADVLEGKNVSLRFSFAKDAVEYLKSK